MDPKPLALAIVAIVILHTAAVTFSSSKSDRELFFGVIVGDKGSEGVLSGIQAAVDDINGNNDLLPGYKLKYDPCTFRGLPANNVIKLVSRLAGSIQYLLAVHGMHMESLKKKERLAKGVASIHIQALPLHFTPAGT